MSISKKAWTFPGRPYDYILYFQKLIESPTTVRQKKERDILGPRDNLEGKSCLADSFLVPAAPEGTYWAPRAAPCKEEWPCRFLSCLMTLSQTGRILSAPNSTQYASKFGKLSSGHRTGKGQFSFQSQRKAMAKNSQTTAQLHSSHMLAK